MKVDKNLFALTPPMGWNSYDYYDTTVNEEQVKANADVMAEKLKSYGWEYVIVDIQWYAHKAGTQRDRFQYIPFSELEMDGYSRLLPDPERFPSSRGGLGFKPLADYVHSLGLKFGIHIMRGIPRIAAHLHTGLLGSALTADQIADPTAICPWNPDMYGVIDSADGQVYYDSLIELYASWGVDYIKCDDISYTDLHPTSHYPRRHEVEMLHRAIAKSGRAIVLSLSPGPALIDQAWHYADNANMWRITGDFWDNWDQLKDMFRRCELWQDHVKPGCYPDCDMLPLGWLSKGFGNERYTNFTFDEAKTMMTLWCIFGSPLMTGCELTKLDEDTLTLLTNRELLSLLDPARRRRQVARNDSFALWVSTNGEDAYAAFFNLGDGELSVKYPLDEVPELSGRTQGAELWTGRTADLAGEALTLPAHGCCIYRLS